MALSSSARDTYCATCKRIRGLKAVPLASAHTQVCFWSSVTASHYPGQTSNKMT